MLYLLRTFWELACYGVGAAVAALVIFKKLGIAAIYISAVESVLLLMRIGMIFAISNDFKCAYQICWLANALRLLFAIYTAATIPVFAEDASPALQSVIYFVYGGAAALYLSALFEPYRKPEAPVAQLPVPARCSPPGSPVRNLSRSSSPGRQLYTIV